jgi:hypothetical protein
MPRSPKRNVGTEPRDPIRGATPGLVPARSGARATTRVAPTNEPAGLKGDATCQASLSQVVAPKLRDTPLPAPVLDFVGSGEVTSPRLAGSCATSRPTTLAEASRDRLAKPVRDPKLWKEFEEATGEPVDPNDPPTWAELIVAIEARLAVTGENGTREAKELRDAAEGAKNESARVAMLLSLDGLPKTNAVSGR